MKRREQIAAALLTVGVGTWIGVFIWVVTHHSIPAYRRPSFPWETAGVIVLIGGAVVLVGVSVLLVAYLTRQWGHERSYSSAKIIALFCTNRQGEIILHPSGYAPNELRYYARLSLPNGESDEFECSYALFQRLREEMTGRALCKGNQLLAFQPDSADY